MFFILILCSELASSSFPWLWLYVTRATRARLCPATCLYLFLYTVSSVEIPKAAIGFALHKCAPLSPSFAPVFFFSSLFLNHSPTGFTHFKNILKSIASQPAVEASGHRHRLWINFLISFTFLAIAQVFCI